MTPGPLPMQETVAPPAPPRPAARRRWRRWIFAGALLLVVGFVTARIHIRNYDIWLGDYFHWLVTPAEPVAGTTHIFFLHCDHFEPGKDFALTHRWAEAWSKLAERHRLRGRTVQHTWFYPCEKPFDENLTVIKDLVTRGYGEAELHLHHGHDTYDSLDKKLEDGVAWFQKFGFLKTVDGETRFAFIHGNWGLDNGRGEQFCGVSREISLLRKHGCYALYDFPALWHESQPKWVNRIYEVTDDDGPKSYDNYYPLTPGHPGGDLTMIEGPLLLVPLANPLRLFLEVEDGNIHAHGFATPERVDRWVKANVHVPGRPEWVFVKVHSHGATSPGDVQATVGDDFDRALTYMESRYNDGVRYRLHYVTAREAYNLIRAAADGQQGDPEQFLDYLIKPYVADPPR